MKELISARRAGLVGGALLAIAFASCGGGSDAPPTPDTLETLIRDGEVLPGGFTIATIESARMSQDLTIAFIASQPGLPSLNGVFVRRPDGNVETVLLPNDPLAGGLSLATVRNLSMSQTGQFAFEVGDTLDEDGLFYFDGSQTHVLARTGDQSVLPGFRILGEIRVTNDGLVVFSDGTSPCTIDTSGGSERIECDLRIHAGNGTSVQEVVVPNALTSQTPTSVILQANVRQEVAVGLPGRGNEPLVGRIRQGEFEGLLNRRQVFPGLGTLLTARPRGISSSGAIAVDGGFDEDGDGARDRERVLLFANGTLTSIESTPGGTFEGNPVTGVRAQSIDGRNRVIYTVDFDSAAAGRELTSLRAWENGQITLIAHAGLPFGGEDEQGNQQSILEIENIRVADNGDVVFIATLGFIEEGTRRITSTALLRWNGGGLENVLQAGASVGGGTLVELSIADVTANGDLLIIGSINREADRALLLLPR